MRALRRFVKVVLRYKGNDQRDDPTPGLMVNAYDPLSFPMTEGPEGDGEGAEYMRLGNVKRVL